MSQRSVRVLYSFPHKLGADRICYTAWQQVNGLAAAGVQVHAMPGVLHRSVVDSVKVLPTLAKGPLRLPYRVLGTIRTLALHDRIVAHRLRKLAGSIDIVHTWPMAARETLKTAAALGIPTVLERPNAHTRFAYESVGEECRRLGVALPPGHEYEFNETILEKEEAEYELATRLLCPSDFVVKTFMERGFRSSHLIRHQYGFDEETFYPATERPTAKGLVMLFVGVAAVRKGAHFAIEAWLRSPAHHDGTFLIVGDFLEDYRKKLEPLVSHPSIRILGHRNDIPDLMRQADILALPSIEEGSPLVVAEAIGSGCVPLVSEAGAGCAGDLRVEGLVHRVSDVSTLCDQITKLHQDREHLSSLRDACLSRRLEFTWKAAGTRLAQAYEEVIATHQHTKSVPLTNPCEAVPPVVRHR